VSFNNAAGFDCQWECGGGKWVSQVGALTVADCYVHDNAGDGLWTDIGTVGVEWLRNHLIDNAGAGLSHEISFAALVEGNVASGEWVCVQGARGACIVLRTAFLGGPRQRLMPSGGTCLDHALPCPSHGRHGAGNGAMETVWLWDGQLQLQNSRDCVVRNNTVYVNASAGAPHAIVMVNTGRPDWPLAVNNTVVDNTVVFQSCGGAVGLVASANETAVARGGNAMNRNVYRLFDGAGASRALWWWTALNASGAGVDVELPWQAFRAATGQEANGTVIPGAGTC
jgi:hypothetical protein